MRATTHTQVVFSCFIVPFAAIFRDGYDSAVRERKSRNSNRHRAMPRNSVVGSRRDGLHRFGVDRRTSSSCEYTEHVPVELPQRMNATRSLNASLINFSLRKDLAREIRFPANPVRTVPKCLSSLIRVPLMGQLPEMFRPTPALRRRRVHDQSGSTGGANRLGRYDR